MGTATWWLRIVHVSCIIMGFSRAFVPKPGRSTPWAPTSWRRVKHPSPMIPSYFNSSIYDHVQHTLRQSAPLIFAEEARTLENELAHACMGKAFVLIGGDCAETFQDSNVNKVWKDFSMFVQLAFVLTYGLEMPIVKIGRMGGQFAKPRSVLMETRNGTTLPSYQGDIINGPEFTQQARVPDPYRMLEAYHYSSQTLNILRAFIAGGYTDVFNHESWSLFHSVGELVDVIYNKTLRELKKTLRFMATLGISSENHKRLRDVSFFIGHECLLLPYEECLVRNDSLTGKYYDCSAHFLWIGERTRELDGPHIEFCRGIHNPIGIKISEKTTPEQLLNMTYLLNPDNIPGHLTIMTRMGHENLRKYLPDLIRILQTHQRHVVWVCDPMHANTHSLKDTKTRYFNEIWKEIFVFLEVHWQSNSIPGGVHFEMTGQNVTECMGGYVEPVVGLDDYQSAMDPRLNPTQAMEMMLLIADAFHHYRNVKDAVGGLLDRSPQE